MANPSKEVLSELQNHRVQRRKAGEIVYPFEYDVKNKPLMNLDVWNNMWIMSCSDGVSMHRFPADKQPKAILDVGCGTGFWALEAAKHYTAATVVGFDCCESQPRLGSLASLQAQQEDQAWNRDLATRVSWVHGNLLDGLPFPPDEFDYVRVVSIGLGVPEDEWQNVLEEICRVMKPGAVLEMLEDDLLFPVGDPPRRSRPQLPPINVELSPMDSFPSGTYSSKSATTTYTSEWSDDMSPWHDRFDSTIGRKSGFMGSEMSLRRLSPKSSKTMQSIPPTLPTPPAPATRTEEEEDKLFGHPQDHTRLKEAWEQMLNKRFLSRSIVSVLPFYLSSTFADVQSFPILHISLPSNSGNLRGSKNGNLCSRLSEESPSPTSLKSPSSGDSMKDELPAKVIHIPNGNNKADTGSKNGHANTPKPPDQFTTDKKGRPYEVNITQITDVADAHASQHLARTMESVRACKEAIWAEYEALYPNELPPVAKTANPDYVKLNAVKSSTRDEFDMLWLNWENDMLDRIGMRDRIGLELLWTLPTGGCPGWLTWRNTVEQSQYRSGGDSFSLHSFETDSTTNQANATNIGRSLRAFIAWKAT